VVFGAPPSPARNVFRYSLAAVAQEQYHTAMSSVIDIEHAVEQLPPEEVRAFRQWFCERDAAEWDRQFEADAAAGRLDSLGEEALKDLREGRCTDL
jgi:uncharacterized membrane protein